MNLLAIKWICEYLDVCQADGFLLITSVSLSVWLNCVVEREGWIRHWALTLCKSRSLFSCKYSTREDSQWQKPSKAQEVASKEKSRGNIAEAEWNVPVYVSSVWGRMLLVIINCDSLLIERGLWKLNWSKRRLNTKCWVLIGVWQVSS